LQSNSEHKACSDIEHENEINFFAIFLSSYGENNRIVF
jgi:hypothetical protein